MKFKYNKPDDVLLIELSKEPIDYAEQTGDLIVHFSPKREAVLLEILDASDFLKGINRALPLQMQADIFAKSQTVAHRIK